MSKNLTILFVSVEGVGHVNACIGLAECLRDRGHKIVFTVDKTFEGKLIRYGFIEEKIFDPNEGKFKNPGEEGAKSLMESGILSGMSSLEKIELMSKQTFFVEMIDKMKMNEPTLKAIIEKHKPDVYIIDHFVGSPTLIYSDKPWVFLFSGNPLFVLDDERTPPGASGMQSNTRIKVLAKSRGQ
jgi:spore coat polysaccharide biosynthesis predicted glycosyltransferase SpsG